jgi:hypothetical protein
MTGNTREDYRGFIIHAHVHEIRNDFGWNSGFQLERNRGAGADAQVWHLPSTYDTSEDAIQAAILQGRKKVDDILQ